ncbi:MAG: ADP-forming succinate--CoA ligase subunit beta [Candidatus Hydrogenedentes bacterium]|nr:ADP-forming succinate--CoA ligase subunit beta [Candidatus Hydrogenedentota bacterium]NLT61391.1 ADP-forming succinate--CoA ligase subunit beta [Candidatus Hydrogenedentota bacterium]HNZ19534.1 ADP-forming succinate--CoA ligase subunit beta [Candidatus Hydrogenedentota bacterium]HOH34956.1 ADP-forming succinate--CoA ligase subunit beta [Candidatus Hydrogenedentota bacterium]HQM33347.1 ADP-forming succinate--CoA ligase subunit beta [Candidatus Hydrogenedentota bacterium]
MKIHEYQAKTLFREAGIPAPGGILAVTPDAAAEAARALGLPVVLKAQVHTGGRGKAGGVQVVSTLADVAPTAARILALTIQGLPVRGILVTPAVDIASEVYLSLLVDRGTRETVFIGCAEGGVDIEQTARETPGKILRLPVEPDRLASLEGDVSTAAFARRLFLDEEQARQATAIMARMARLFVEKDCSLIEINPLVVTGSGDVLALDAKVLLDDNALFRHPELVALRDLDSEDADELAAKEAGLSFIRLDGDIGCMVNGAGLAMATMDTIHHFGGRPANFLDVGGSSDPAKVVTAFRMILQDPKVKVILINIFGGITRCDDIARGILQSLSECDVPVPIVIRLIGTNQAEGRRLLEGARLIPAATLEEAAVKAVEMGGRA